jgi:hypothetical protein
LVRNRDYAAEGQLWGAESGAGVQRVWPGEYSLSVDRP